MSEEDRLRADLEIKFKLLKQTHGLEIPDTDNMILEEMQTVYKQYIAKILEQEQYNVYIQRYAKELNDVKQIFVNAKHDVTDRQIAYFVFKGSFEKCPIKDRIIHPALFFKPTEITPEFIDKYMKDEDLPLDYMESFPFNVLNCAIL